MSGDVTLARRSEDAGQRSGGRQHHLALPVTPAAEPLAAEPLCSLGANERLFRAATATF